MTARTGGWWECPRCFYREVRPGFRYADPCRCCPQPHDTDEDRDGSRTIGELQVQFNPAMRALLKCAEGE